MPPLTLHLDLEELPELVAAAKELIRVVSLAVDPEGEKGKKISRAELGQILKVTWAFLSCVVDALT